MATVSMTNATTPKLTNRYVCYTDGTDIACNAPILYLRHLLRGQRRKNSIKYR